MIAAVKSVNIQLGEVEVTLNLDEARVLYDSLREIFETKVTKEHVPQCPVWPWTYPTVTYGGRPMYRDVVITCNTDTPKTLEEARARDGIDRSVG